MRLSGLLLVWLAAVWPQAAWSAPLAEEARVRTGTTELHDGASDGAAIVESRREAPADAPRSQAGQLRLPDVPAGFNTYDGGWIKFVYHPSIRERVQPLIADAPTVRTSLTEWVGQPVLSEVRVMVARTPGEMATLAPPNAPYPDYAAGVAYPEIGLVLLTVKPVHANVQQDLNEVFRHELAHVALEDAVAGRPIPRWFNEGFAVMASGETSFVRMSTLVNATFSGRLLSLAQLERTFPSNEDDAGVAYAQAADVVRFLVRRQELHRFRGLVSRLRDGETMDGALLNSYGEETTSLETEWRDDVTRRYAFFPALGSGSLVWAGTLGLFALGWRKKRKKAQATLARWRKEEAAEDEMRKRLALRVDTSGPSPRVHIVLARNQADDSAPPSVPPAMLQKLPDVEVPKVEHDGQWHTLH
ncbi:MAG TPA: peptidase MA family metallohydrolase [Polyangiaceae bacterium]|nr:peptidase MA family metallohydrolase [Polyangiaceae bacterium]